MNILFYASFTHRSRDTESLMHAFKKQGHLVFFLNQHADSVIKPYLEANGVEVFEYTPKSKNRWIRHLLNIRMLVIHCRKLQIDRVYSHLEPANFIAVLAQFFIRSRVYVCRHHRDLFVLLKINRDLSYRITYKLARHIIVVSESTKQYMIQHEHVPALKIKVINLAYDFSLYGKPNSENVEALKKSIDAPLCLLTIGNLNDFKKPMQSLEVLNTLIKKGYAAKLIFLGKGELEEAIRERSKALNIASSVIMPGYVTNVLDYLSVSTFLLHPSESESSCVVVKEAGLTETPVIVCKGVGDFDAYILDKSNGFLVDCDQFAQQATERIEQTFEDKQLLKKLGSNLKESVFQNFSIEHILPQYDTLNNQ